MCQGPRASLIRPWTNDTTNVTLMAFLTSDFIYLPSGEAMACMGHRAVNFVASFVGFARCQDLA